MKKQYKVKLENGQIKPLEHIDINQDTSGIVIFFDSNDESKKNNLNKKLWEACEEVMSEVPEEELKLLPADGSIEHDHYIYGLPKKGHKLDD